jgi:peptide/nickel transport system substrate-binding protein
MIYQSITRRRLIELGLAAGAVNIAGIPSGLAAEQPVRGGQLIVAQSPEPPILTSALTVAGPTQMVSGKIFDGLIEYDLDLNPKPKLAKSWTVSPDGLTITFALQPGVTWHDGAPFTSEDVAYSVLEIWKKFHSRGRSTFANVIAAETPDPLTVIWKLSQPAPYILNALPSVESQVLPKHLYAGTDVLTNPRNIAPIGTGPFRFVKWEKGAYIALERYPDYWDKPAPYLDKVIFRILPDAAERATALETGEVQVARGMNLTYSDIPRLAAIPDIELTRHNRTTLTGIAGFEFNLDRPYFKDVRVRQAFAHAIDRDFILKNIWFGYGQVATGPIPPSLVQFYTADVPTYPFDLHKAADLLDQAGFKPDANGIRLTITHDPAPTDEAFTRIGEYLRDALGKVGVKVNVRSQDFATFIRRVYTDRDFDTIAFQGNAGLDPAISVQRLYWSKNFQPGVAFSNGSHYSSPEADSLLERAQVEIDPLKRRDLYVKFQELVQTDLPRIPLIAPDDIVLTQKRVRQLITTGDDTAGSFSETYLA